MTLRDQLTEQALALPPEDRAFIARLLRLSLGDGGDASALTERLAELAEKANEGNLSQAERDEYEAYIEANNHLAAARKSD